MHLGPKINCSLNEKGIFELLIKVSFFIVPTKQVEIGEFISGGARCTQCSISFENILPLPDLVFLYNLQSQNQKYSKYW